jgi:hypothetical protein
VFYKRSWSISAPKAVSYEGSDTKLVVAIEHQFREAHASIWIDNRLVYERTSARQYGPVASPVDFSGVGAQHVALHSRNTGPSSMSNGACAEPHHSGTPGSAHAEKSKLLQSKHR